MKTTLGVIAGIIVGAIGMELLNKTNPELVEDIEGKIKNGLDSIKKSVSSESSVEEATSEA
jgi:hypothetical protein